METIGIYNVQIWEKRLSGANDAEASTDLGQFTLAPERGLRFFQLARRRR
jgi:hypothetical protein